MIAAIPAPKTRPPRTRRRADLSHDERATFDRLLRRSPGAALCTGAWNDDAGIYEHDGPTCPVHEDPRGSDARPIRFTPHPGRASGAACHVCRAPADSPCRYAHLGG